MASLSKFYYFQWISADRLVFSFQKNCFESNIIRLICDRIYSFNNNVHLLLIFGHFWKYLSQQITSSAKLNSDSERFLKTFLHLEIDLKKYIDIIYIGYSTRILFDDQPKERDVYQRFSLYK